jgi:hypothetical protein
MFFRAFVGLVLFDVFRLSKHFAALHRIVSSWKTNSHKSAPDVLPIITEAIDYACAWYPKRVLCLQRAAVMTCLLRNRGVSAEMVLGAQELPFKAHAWVEVNGSALNEVARVHQIYRVWDRF